MDNFTIPEDIKEYELLFDNVLILPDATEEQTSGGLFLPEDAQRKKNTGIVVAIGRGKQAPGTAVMIEMQVQVGDRVIYDSFAAVPWQNTKYVMCEQGYIKSKLK